MRRGLLLVALISIACSSEAGSGTDDGGTGGDGTGGDVSTGGLQESGGASSATGGVSTGGVPSSGGESSSGGLAESGGAPSTGGQMSTGGVQSTGGTSTGGSTTGGTSSGGASTGGNGNGGTAPLAVCSPPELSDDTDGGDDCGRICEWDSETAPWGYGAGNGTCACTVRTLASTTNVVANYVSLIPEDQSCPSLNGDRVYRIVGGHCTRIYSPFGATVTTTSTSALVSSGSRTNVPETSADCRIVTNNQASDVDKFINVSADADSWVHTSTAALSAAACPLTCPPQ